MKRIDFTTAQGKFAFHQLPDSTYDAGRAIHPPRLWYKDEDGLKIADDILMLDGDWVIGFADELTFSQWSTVLDYKEVGGRDYPMYFNYTDDTYSIGNVLLSAHTLMKKLGVDKEKTYVLIQYNYSETSKIQN